MVNIVRCPSFALDASAVHGAGADAEQALFGWTLFNDNGHNGRWSIYPQKHSCGVGRHLGGMRLVCTTAHTPSAHQGVSLDLFIPGSCAAPLIDPATGTVRAFLYAFDLEAWLGAGSAQSFPLYVTPRVHVVGGTAQGGGDTHGERTWTHDVELAASQTPRRVHIAMPADGVAKFRQNSVTGVHIQINLSAGSQRIHNNDTPENGWNVSNSRIRKTERSAEFCDVTGTGIQITAIKVEPGTSPTEFEYGPIERAADMFWFGVNP